MSTTRTEVEFDRSVAKCELVQTRERAIELLEQIDEAALDYETTSLDPDDGEIRITSICNATHHFMLDHFFIGAASEYLPYMEGKTWWVYNGKFECKWSDEKHPDNTELDIRDVDFLAKIKLGGGYSSLAKMCKRDLGIELVKDEQASDWSKPVLTKSQYNYAGFDSHVTWMLREHWFEELSGRDWGFGFDVFNDAVRATSEAERTGLFLDSVYHAKNVDLWRRKQDTFKRYIRKFTPKNIIENLNSDAQLGKFLEAELHPDMLAVWPRTAKTDRLQMANPYLRSVARRLPYPMSRWMAAVVGYRYYAKYLSTYGDTLLTKQALSGKITSRFNIGQAGTGRYSSSSINLQNIPRKIVVRKAFQSPDRGVRELVLADYSGIEIRVLAELSGDKQLLEDAIYGDVHAASASQIYGHDYEYVLEVLASKGEGRFANIFYVIKEQRSKAKGFTFQLLYGAAAEALSDVLKCTYEEAAQAIIKWAERYPLAYDYRSIMFSEMKHTGFLPVCDGRTIKVHKLDQTMPVAANYPIQGAAASVMYRAMYHTRRLFMERDLDAYICSTVHDELLSTAHKEHSEAAMEAQLEAMRLGWLDIFPGTNTDNLTDSAIGSSWAAKP